MSTTHAQLSGEDVAQHECAVHKVGTNEEVRGWGGRAVDLVGGGLFDL